MSLNLEYSEYFCSSQRIKGKVINCLIDNICGYNLGQPHGTAPALVTTNEDMKVSSLKNSGNIQKKRVGLTDLFNIIISLQ